MSSTFDPDEHQRLCALYASMSDEELELLAADFDSLTPVARDALIAEADDRDMDIEWDNSPAAPRAENFGPPLVTIAHFRDLHEAVLARSCLESAAIPSFLADENLIRMDWFYSNLIGGVRLQVREEDAEAATRLLQTADAPPHEAPFGPGPLCPHCVSDEVAFERINAPATLAASVVLGVPFPVPRNQYRCRTCGTTWRPKDD